MALAESLVFLVADRGPQPCHHPSTNAWTPRQYKEPEFPLDYHCNCVPHLKNEKASTAFCPVHA